MIIEKLNQKNIILASNSPRRKEILNDTGIKFKVITKDIEEIYPENLSPKEIVEYLSKLKSLPFKNLGDNDVIITADTIVSFNQEILGKPKNKKEAEKILHSLSENENEVLTGVCIKTKNSELTFSEKTKVYFGKLEKEEIDFYIEEYSPYDKAGAYGIQEWIGKIGIKKIDGCFYNVVGFPIYKFLKEINALI